MTFELASWKAPSEQSSLKHKTAIGRRRCCHNPNSVFFFGVHTILIFKASEKTHFGRLRDSLSKSFKKQRYRDLQALVIRTLQHLVQTSRLPGQFQLTQNTDRNQLDPLATAKRKRMKNVWNDRDLPQKSRNSPLGHNRANPEDWAVALHLSRPQVTYFCWRNSEDVVYPCIDGRFRLQVGILKPLETGKLAPGLTGKDLGTMLKAQSRWTTKTSQACIMYIVLKPCPSLCKMAEENDIRGRSMIRKKSTKLFTKKTVNIYPPPISFQVGYPCSYNSWGVGM